MRRREFISLLGGAAVAWSLSARAQQSGGMRRVGILLPAAADDAEYQVRVGAFLQGLQQSGWTVGSNVRIDTRWATTNADTIRRHAAELAALAPDVILAHGSPAVEPLLQATRAVPIVFAVVADPVAAGFVDSLARPGGSWCAFPLAPALRSTDSAAVTRADTSAVGAFALFTGFIATMTRSDFSCPCFIGYGSSPSRCGPSLSLDTDGQSRDIPASDAIPLRVMWP